MDEWAAAEGFKLKHADDVRRVYRRGIGIGTAPAYVQVIYAPPWSHLQAWVGVNLLVRPGALIISPGELSLEAGGFRLARSRRIAQASVNRLLERFDLPLIE